MVTITQHVEMPTYFHTISSNELQHVPDSTVENSKMFTQLWKINSDRKLREAFCYYLESNLSLFVRSTIITMKSMEEASLDRGSGNLSHVLL